MKILHTLANKKHESIIYGCLLSRKSEGNKRILNPFILVHKLTITASIPVSLLNSRFTFNLSGMKLW